VNYLLGYNHLLSYDLVKSGARLFLFLQLCDAAPLFLPLHYFCRSVISAASCCCPYLCRSVLPLIFLPLRYVKDPLLCWHLWAKSCPNNLSDKLRSESLMNIFPLDFWWLLVTRCNSDVSTDFGIYCTCKYTKYGTYLEDASTVPYEPFNKITFNFWRGWDLNWGPFER
jgi:hypothetical protein